MTPTQYSPHLGLCRRATGVLHAVVVDPISDFRPSGPGLDAGDGKLSAKQLAISSAWLKPRQRCRRRCRGIGIIKIFLKESAKLHKISTIKTFLN